MNTEHLTSPIVVGDQVKVLDPATGEHVVGLVLKIESDEHWLSLPDVNGMPSHGWFRRYRLRPVAA